jgi:hypothetical protein
MTGIRSSVLAAKEVAAAAWKYMKGKKKRSGLRLVSQQHFGFKYDLDFGAELPCEETLARLAAKHFRIRARSTCQTL